VKTRWRGLLPFGSCFSQLGNGLIVIFKLKRRLSKQLKKVRRRLSEKTESRRLSEATIEQQKQLQKKFSEGSIDMLIPGSTMRNDSISSLSSTDTLTSPQASSITEIDRRFSNSSTGVKSHSPSISSSKSPSVSSDPGTEDEEDSSDEEELVDDLLLEPGQCQILFLYESIN
jgi:hypothetical protein